MTCQHCNTHYEVTTWHAAHGKRKQAFANHSAYSDWGSDASSKRLQSEFDCFNGAKKRLFVQRWVNILLQKFRSLLKDALAFNYL